MKKRQKLCVKILNEAFLHERFKKSMNSSLPQKRHKLIQKIKKIYILALLQVAKSKLLDPK